MPTIRVIHIPSGELALIEVISPIEIYNVKVLLSMICVRNSCPRNIDSCEDCPWKYDDYYSNTDDLIEAEYLIEEV